MSRKWLPMTAAAVSCIIASCGKAQTPSMSGHDSISALRTPSAADMVDSSRQATLTSDTVEPVARSLVYDLNNHDPMKFGWTADKEGPFNGSGPSALAVLGERIYVADNAHRNIKSIDIGSGRISILPTGLLTDVVAYNGSVYVVHGGNDSVFVYTPDLKLLRVIPIPHVRGERTFVKTANQPLRLVAGETGITLSSDQASIDTLNRGLPHAQFDLSKREIKAHTTDSAKWYVQLLSGRWIQLKDSIPGSNPNWYGYNADVDSARLAYYVLVNRKIIFYIYSAPSSR